MQILSQAHVAVRMFDLGLPFLNRDFLSLCADEVVVGANLNERYRGAEHAQLLGSRHPLDKRCQGQLVCCSHLCHSLQLLSVGSKSEAKVLFDTARSLS